MDELPVEKDDVHGLPIRAALAEEHQAQSHKAAEFQPVFVFAFTFNFIYICQYYWYSKRKGINPQKRI